MHTLKKIIKSFDTELNKKAKEQNKNKLKEGCFVYELEADSTIPSEYILHIKIKREDVKISENKHVE